MLQCHQCNKHMSPDESVYRTVKTGVYSGGGDFFRNVKICPECNSKLDNSAKTERTKKGLLIVAALVAVAAGILYFLYYR